MDYLVKVAIFVPFVAVLYFVIDFFMNKLQVYISGSGYSAVLCQFGVFDGLNIFFSFLISGFFVNHVIDFAK